MQSGVIVSVFVSCRECQNVTKLLVSQTDNVSLVLKHTIPIGIRESSFPSLVGVS